MHSLRARDERELQWRIQELKIEGAQPLLPGACAESRGVKEGGCLPSLTRISAKQKVKSLAYCLKKVY